MGCGDICFLITKREFTKMSKPQYSSLKQLKTRLNRGRNNLITDNSPRQLYSQLDKF